MNRLLVLTLIITTIGYNFTTHTATHSHTKPNEIVPSATRNMSHVYRMTQKRTILLEHFASLHTMDQLNKYLNGGRCHYHIVTLITEYGNCFRSYNRPLFSYYKGLICIEEDQLSVVGGAAFSPIPEEITDTYPISNLSTDSIL